jgi:signal transduction histidine kinase
MEKINYISFSVLTGIYISLAIYHLMVYFGRRNDKNNLYYVVLLLSCTYITITKGLIGELTPFDTTITIYFKVFFQYTATTFAVCSMLIFVYKSLELKCVKKLIVTYTYYLPCLIAVVYTLFLITGDSKTYIRYVVLLGMPPGAILWIWMLFQFYSKKNIANYSKSKSIVAISSGAYCASYVIFPVFFYKGYSFAFQLYIVSIGMIIMVASSAYALVKQFNNEHKELIETKKHLEKKVVDRTRELEVSNQQKTNAFINVAHEIKTPLTIINNSLSRYKSQVSDNEFLREISYNVDTLLKNANDFIDTEKLTGGKTLYVHDSSVDFSRLLLQKTDSFRHIAGNNYITIEHEIEDDIIIKADPVAIDRVLNNLLNNAIHYNRPSGSIVVTLKRTDTKVTLVVKDTGIGISQEHQQHIFEPYYQVSQKKKNSQGIGMGLYITSEIVRSLDGTIEVDSSEGEGSSFIVNLKACSNTEHADANVANVTKPLDFPAYTEISDIVHDTSDFPVLLVVEDKKSLLKAIRDYMSDNYDVLCAVNGKVATDKITTMKKVPDCIVSDIMMDEMDGFAFLDTLRNDEKLKAVPFIFLTAKSSDSEKVEGLQKGATAYIAKPFSMDVLKAKIDSMLEYNALKQKLFELEKYHSIGVMTASICHQILNPLAGIRGPIYVIEKAIEKAGAGTEKIDKNILFVKENSNRINDIVETLRSLFKGHEFAVEEIRVKQYISSLVAIFAEKVNDYIEFSIEIDDNLTIQMNKGALTQIMINLLSNAIEAINENGKILITGNEQRISIKDNGCGIPKEHLDKVFDLHYTTKPEGTGFGMYLVKQLVERLGITMKIQSTVGEGTEVVLELENKCVAAV